MHLYLQQYLTGNRSRPEILDKQETHHQIRIESMRRRNFVAIRKIYKKNRPMNLNQKYNHLLDLNLLDLGFKNEFLNNIIYLNIKISMFNPCLDNREFCNFGFHLNHRWERHCIRLDKFATLSLHQNHMLLNSRTNHSMSQMSRWYLKKCRHQQYMSYSDCIPTAQLNVERTGLA